MTQQLDDLAKFYKSLSNKGALPLNQSDEYYVEILEKSPESDPILSLFQRIELADSESVNLLTGFRGNGKSTQLKRLKDMLEENGCQVFLVDMLEYVMMTRPLELSDFILSLMAALAGTVESSSEENLKPLSQSYWKRFANFLSSNVELEKLNLGIDLGIKANLGFRLKTDPEFKNQIQQHFKGHLTRLVEDAKVFVTDLVDKIRELSQDQDKKVVFLVDSLEQLRGVGEDAPAIYDSVLELFSGQAENLSFPKLHVVYTVPPYLNALAPNLVRNFGENPMVQWPNIHVRNRDNNPDQNGLEVMEHVINKRFKEWQKYFSQEQLQELAENSGGDLRDFFRLVREAVGALRIKLKDNEQAKMDKTIINRATQQLRNELLPLAEDDAKWLAKVHESKQSSLPSKQNLPDLARFLDSNRIMNYLNGQPWYDVHPLLIEEIENINAKHKDTSA